MKIETFFEKFDQFADAPDAVAKMRRLILHLAIQGRLVPQIPSEVPAMVTFRNLIPAMNRSDDKYPKHWLRVRLGDLGDWRGGGTPSKLQPAYWEGDIPWVSPKDMKVSYIFDAQDHISATALDSCSVRLIPPGSLLMVVRGMILAHTFPVAIATREVTINQDMKALLPSYPETKDFLLLALHGSAPEVLAAIERSTHGTCKLETAVLQEFIIPVPPLAEQKRIVAKVDELMALCDQLEALQQEREAQQAALARASLARFAAEPTPANLNFIFHPTYTITPADLRKSILTLAVQGNLVPQDPNDEPVEILSKLDGELAAKALFETPQGWVWTRLSEVTEINGGFAFKSTAYTDEGTRVIRISDFDEFGFKDNKVVRHPFTPDLKKFTLAENNILMAMTGGTVGKSYLVRTLPEPMIVNQRVATIKVLKSAMPGYIDIVIRSEMTQEVIRTAKNSTNDNISMADIKGFTTPLPPLAEQHRIVAKVEQLMALVDELETQLTASRDTSANLLSALVTELTAVSTPSSHAE